MPKLLEVRGLSRHFDGITAVDNFGATLEEGEFVSIIGPNGAGKTTLFNLVSGLDRADTGEVHFAGDRIERMKPQRIAELGMARTFQHGRVFANLSVLENVLLGSHVLGQAMRQRWQPWSSIAELGRALLRTRGTRAREAELTAEAQQILSLFGDRLLPRLHQPTYSLSYANRRRVEIARALALHPRLLLLDEPTAGMNETETAEMLAIIGELKARRQSILLIEHKLDLVMQLSDRVIVMDDGRTISHGRPEEIRRDPAVIEAYLGHRRVSNEGTAT